MARCVFYFHANCLIVLFEYCFAIIARNRSSTTFRARASMATLFRRFRLARDAPMSVRWLCASIYSKTDSFFTRKATMCRQTFGVDAAICARFIDDDENEAAVGVHGDVLEIQRDRVITSNLQRYAKRLSDGVFFFFASSRSKIRHSLLTDLINNTYLFDKFRRHKSASSCHLHARLTRVSPERRVVSSKLLLFWTCKCIFPQMRV